MCFTLFTSSQNHIEQITKWNLEQLRKTDWRLQAIYLPREYALLLEVSFRIITP